MLNEPLSRDALTCPGCGDSRRCAGVVTCHVDLRVPCNLAQLLSVMNALTGLMMGDQRWGLEKEGNRARNINLASPNSVTSCSLVCAPLFHQAPSPF